jgi:peptidoglycan/xylan/chitin deacetylase (PgdA/CDA1 family)
MTLSEFRDVLVEQQERDVRLPPKKVILAISDVTPENVTEVSDVLRASNVTATIFIPTKFIGLEGITEKQILNLLANGNDIQSGGHTGDDLRSLTNAQVELELAQSRKIIEEMTKQAVFAIGYPIGGVNERVAQKAGDAGYLLGIGAAQERSFVRADLLRIPSFGISASSTAEEVVGLVTGQ